MTRPTASRLASASQHQGDAFHEKHSDEAIGRLATAGHGPRPVPAVGAVLVVVGGLVAVASLVGLVGVHRTSARYISPGGATIGALLIVCTVAAILLRFRRQFLRTDGSSIDASPTESGIRPPAQPSVD